MLWQPRSRNEDNPLTMVQRQHERIADELTELSAHFFRGKAQRFGQRQRFLFFFADLWRGLRDNIKISCTFAPVIIKYDSIMSEKQKQVEKERKGVLELLLQKNGLKRRELVDFLLGVWMAGKIDELTEEEKAQFPNLVF